MIIQEIYRERNKDKAPCPILSIVYNKYLI